MARFGRLMRRIGPWSSNPATSSRFRDLRWAVIRFPCRAKPVLYPRVESNKTASRSGHSGRLIGRVQSTSNIAFEFVRSLASELSNGHVDLPSFPEIALRVRRVLSDPDTSLEKVVRVVGSE